MGFMDDLLKVAVKKIAEEVPEFQKDVEGIRKEFDGLYKEVVLGVTNEEPTSPKPKTIRIEVKTDEPTTN